jgi:UDP-glucose 6-dehydrogenase
MKITIFGAGYVGLITGVCFADIGHQVICVDINADKINYLQSGKTPIYEPGLAELLKKQPYSMVRFNLLQLAHLRKKTVQPIYNMYMMLQQL